jgi:hypothetical protein
MPVVEALYREPGAPRPNPYDFPAGLAYDEKTGSQRWNVLNDLMGIWLIDAQSELRAAWKRLIARGCPPEQVEQLCAPPVTGPELAALVEAWKDPRRKQEITQRWAMAARERYRRLAE